MGMSFVSLDRLVKGGHVEEADAPRVEELWTEIRRLKREKTRVRPRAQLPGARGPGDRRHRR